MAGGRRGRRAAQLRAEPPLDLSPSRKLHRANPQWRQASRSAGDRADQDRAGNQPQDSQRARPRHSLHIARSRRRGHRMKRREFIVLLGGAAGLRPLAALAQQKPTPGSRIPVVGVLLNEPPEPAFAGFHEKFRELGYEEGRNVRLEIRSADAKSERLPGLAAELVGMKVDVIISAYTPPTRAAINATKQIPIVMTSVDPLVGGFVTNLSHPGGNVTGVAGYTCEVGAKRLQLLKDAVPTVSRIAVLRNPDGGSAGGLCGVQETERAAQ